MLALLYLGLSMIFGISLINFWINTEEIYAKIGGEDCKTKIPKELFIFPAGIIIGIIIITFFNYYLIFILNKFNQKNEINFPLGVCITILLFLTLSIVMVLHNRNKEKNHEQDNKNNIMFYIIVIGIVILVTNFLMFYTYRIEDGKLLLGYTTFSDLAQHTAMVSSFGIGGNVPTQYMHFSGDGINWHFFFYFFAGILKYLGFPIDYALNVPTILTMSSTLCLVGLLSTLFVKRKTAFLIAPILVLFRSSFNIFYVIKKLMISKTYVLDGILKSTEWSDITPFDNWGIWAINVYPNQRHFMLGIGAILIVIILFIPFLFNMMENLKTLKLKEKIKYFIFSKKAWLSKPSDKRFIIALLLIIMLPYFHGSALIAGLLILFGMAIFSENRLYYLILAIVAVISSQIQTKIFSGGAENIINFSFHVGFVSEDTTFWGIMNYIFTITGITIILALVYLILQRKNKKFIILFVSFMLPFVFAFLFQITKETLASHKFIQISVILIDIFVAGVIARLLNSEKEKYFKIYLSIHLIILLTATGFSEWCTFININKNFTIVDTKSNLIKWIEENTEKNDVFLTPMWSTNRFFLAGRPAFFGWPYYAWSAGHDTNARELEYKYLLQGCNGNREEFIEICKKYNIKYIVDDIEMNDFKDEITGITFYNQYFIQNNFELVAEFEEENTRIYMIQ